MLVTLTEQEVQEADTLTQAIIDNSIKNNRVFRLEKAKNISTEEMKQLKFDGFRAEKAASKGLGLRWNNHLYTDEEFVDKKNRATDLGARLEVKSTTWPNGCLIINASDLRDARYMLVIINGRCQYDLRGWCVGHELMIPEFYRSVGQPAFFIPQTKLRPIDSLIRLTDNFLKSFSSSNGRT